MTDYTIFTGNGPNTDAGDPGAPVNLGLIFQSSVTVWAKAIRFYRGATTITGTPKGRIFAVAGQTVVSGTAVDFPALSGVGWQVASLPTPVQLTANTSYKVAVAFDDNYTATVGYWSTGAGVGGVTNGPLTAPDAGGVPLGLGPIQQGSYRYTSDPDLYPNSYIGGGQYWVDLLVTDVDPNAAQTITMGLPVEEDTALPVALAKTMTTGLPADSESALAVSLAKTATLGLPVDTSEPFPVVLAKAVTLGLPGEMAEALAATLGKSLTQGLPVEQDSALATVFLETIRLGLPIEQDTALALLTDDSWPPTVGPPVERRWATSGPPTGHRWASTGPPSETAG